MHYLQNSWFISHWTILLFFFAISIVFVAYINNRSRLLKQAIASTSVLLVFNVVVFFTNINSPFIDLTPSFENNLKNEKVESSDQSIATKLFELALGVAKERISE
jgi:hypothetical protein